jgi:hypothetical protein
MFKKRLSKPDLRDAQELQRLAGSFAYVAQAIGRNTLQVPRGKDMKAHYEAVTRLLEQEKKEFIAAALLRAGCKDKETVTVNLETGEISPVAK